MTDGEQRANENTSIDFDEYEFAAKMVSVTGILNSCLDLDTVYDHLIDSVGNVIPMNACNLLLVSGNEGEVIRQRGYNKTGTAEILNSRIFDLRKVKTFAKMLRNRQTICIADTHENSDWVPMPESFWVRSFISAPIVVNDQVYAFINCDNALPNTFLPKHANRLKIVADQAAIAIQNALENSETRRRLKQIALINEITQTMLESTNIEEILHLLPERLLPIFDANSLLISKWDEDKQIASKLGAFGPGVMPNLPQEDKPGEMGITQQILKKKHPLIISSGNEYGTLLASLNKLTTDRVILALPLIAQEVPLGAILIGFKDRKQISEAEFSVAEFAAMQIATILHKSDIYERAKVQSVLFQHANDLIASLSLLATSTMSSKGLTEIIHTMGDGLERMNIHSVVFFFDNVKGVLTLEYCSRFAELISILNNLDFSSGHRFVLKVPTIQRFRSALFEQRIEFFDNPLELLRQLLPVELGPFLPKFLDALDIKTATNALFMPLVVEQKTIGLLGLYGVNLQEIDLKAGEIFNGQISVAIENSRLLDEVQRLAVTDDLTGIKNRRGLFENGNREVIAAKRLNHPLAVLMIDLDNFKDINDKYGHQVGDAVLREVAKRISENVREIDVVGRYGGEEFVVLLIEDELATAMVVAERIRQAVADITVQTDIGKIKLTISIGVDEIDASTASLDQLIKRADLALYVAKRDGKNRVATLTDLKKPTT